MGTPVRRPKMSVQSPLYRKIQALRLHATPATPKTLLRKATTETPTHDRFSKPLATGSFAQTPENPTKVFALHNKALQPVMANINPFSPSSKFSRLTYAAKQMPNFFSIVFLRFSSK